jgi:hypothetical protein
MKVLQQLFASFFIIFYAFTTAALPITAFAQGQGAATALVASPTSGTAPLTITFNGRIYKGNGVLNYGDGSSVTITFPSTLAANEVYTFPAQSHTYRNPGTYTAVLTDPDTTAKATITVASPGARPTCNIIVNPSSIGVGGSVTVQWASTNATAGAITNIGNVGVSGSINLLPSSAPQTTYFGSFTGPNGTANCQATVTVSSTMTGSGTSGGGDSSQSSGGTGTTGTNSTGVNSTSGTSGTGVNSTSGTSGTGVNTATAGTPITQSANPGTTLTTPSGSSGTTLPLSSSDVSSGGLGRLVPCGFGTFDPTRDSSSNHSSSTACQACDLATLIQRVITFAIGLSIPIAAALFAWAGVLFFTAADNSSKITQAKQIFKNAFIGFLIAITAWLIINTVLAVIFNGSRLITNGQWFTIQCAETARPVNATLNQVLGSINGSSGNSVNTGGTPSFDIYGNPIVSGGGGSGGNSNTDAAVEALTAQCAVKDQTSCDALDSMTSNNNQLTDKVDEALSTGCDNGIQSSCDALIKITGNLDQTQGALGASASSIADAALAYRGTDTSAGPDGGNKACAWAVNNILKSDGVAPLDGDSVAGMEQALQSRATYVVNTSDAQRGDIIIWKEGTVSHVGICEASGCTQAVSNSSGDAAFTGVSGPTLMGVPGRVYHMNP